MAITHELENPLHDLALWVSAFYSCGMRQLQLFFHQHEGFLLAGSLAIILLLAGLLFLTLPKIEDEYLLCPSEVNPLDESSEGEHWITSLGFGATGLIINIWPIVEFVTRVWTKLARTSWDSFMVFGVTVQFTAFRYLVALHGGWHDVRGLIPVMLATEALALVIVKAYLDQLKPAKWILGRLGGYTWEASVVIGMSLMFFSLGFLLAFFGVYDDGIHPLVLAAEDAPLVLVLEIFAPLVALFSYASSLAVFLKRKFLQLIFAIDAFPQFVVVTPVDKITASLGRLSASLLDRVGTSAS